jgi:hypothetical protein
MKTENYRHYFLNFQMHWNTLCTIIGLRSDVHFCNSELYCVVFLICKYKLEAIGCASFNLYNEEFIGIEKGCQGVVMYIILTWRLA